jgi:hypothetical protein
VKENCPTDSQKVAQHVAQKVAQNVAQKVAQNVAQKVAQNVAQLANVQFNAQLSPGKSILKN